MALRFRRNVLRLGESHRVTRAIREYRKPGVGRGAVHARHRRVPSLPSILRALSPHGGVHGPFRLAAGEILREPAVRFGDAPDPDAVFPGFPGGGGERLFRAGGLATEERGVAADRPPASPEPVERRTEPDDIAADFLAEARPHSQSGLDGVPARTEPVEGVVDLVLLDFTEIEEVPRDEEAVRGTRVRE